jgi:hypothetical protein
LELVSPIHGLKTCIKLIESHPALVCLETMVN